MIGKSDRIGGAVADIFDALIATLGGTRLEPDLETLIWSTVNLFHRAADRVQRELDGNEYAQKRSQKEQDGSEIRSVELERLVAEGLTLIERRNAKELFRDQAADQFEHHTGSAWRPRRLYRFGAMAATRARAGHRQRLQSPEHSGVSEAGIARARAPLLVSVLFQHRAWPRRA